MNAPVPARTSKLRGVNFDDLDSEVPAGPQADRPRTGPGAFSASLAMGREVVDENTRLKEELARLEGAELIQVLDPEEVGPSKFANRLDDSFLTSEYVQLKMELEAAGGNVQPIKVRRLAKPRGKIKYEIVFGHRRHHGCLELKLPLRAFVVDEDEVSIEQMVIEMERENRNREDLTPWEQGVFYAKLLDEKVFHTVRQLGERLGVHFTTAGKAVQLARLPSEVVAAFRSPLEIQFRWGALLQSAVDRDRDRVLKAAAEIRKADPRPAAKAVLDQLLGVSDAEVKEEKTEFKKAGGKVAAVWTKTGRGGAVLTIKPGAISAATERKLLDLLARSFPADS